MRVGGAENATSRARACRGLLAHGDEPLAERDAPDAAQHAIDRANPLEQTRYKLPMITATVLETLEKAAGAP
jgi:CO/xanthine dehydrogenase FAD-binding subunit